MERRSFDREFRDGAVRIVRETGKPVAQVARELARSPRPSRAGPDRHAARVEAYADAGVDEADVQQIGPDMAVFVAAREKDVPATPSCWSSQPTLAPAPWRGADTRTLNRDRPTTWAD